MPAGINTNPSGIREYSQIVQTSLTKLCSALLSVTSCPQVAACQWFVLSLLHSSANVCACANFSIASVAVYSHTLQLLSLEPSASSVAAFVTVQSPNVCSALSVTSVFSYPQIVQVVFLSPFSVQVASLVTVHSPKLCSALLSVMSCSQVAAC